MSQDGSLPFLRMDAISNPLKDLGASPGPERARQTWLRVLSCSSPSELESLLDPFVESLPCTVVEVRRPEVGLALVAGRIGGTGDQFGVGEMTLTRCVVEVDGIVGVGYVSGRAPAHSRRVATADALLQASHHGVMQRTVLEPLRASAKKRRERIAAEVETTRVQFLTMVRES
jgi:alpha-D-ribose 1-methylphosphonate 5-triphosphate synthase subunit PhnG